MVDALKNSQIQIPNEASPPEVNRYTDRLNFERWLQLKNLKPRTVKEYCYYLGKFPNAFKQDTVEEFLSQHNNPIARAFIASYRRYLLKGRGMSSPDILNVEIPRMTGRKKRRIPRVLEESEIFRLEDAMRKERDRIMLLLSFYCGLRLGGLVGIRPYDFNWKRWWEHRDKVGELKVREKGDKERICFVPASLMARVEKWIREEASKKKPDKTQPLFITPRRWQIILDKASVKAFGQREHPHTLRHSCATWLLKNGMPLEKVKDFLGHESIVSTQIYAHVGLESIRESYEFITNDLRAPLEVLKSQSEKELSHELIEPENSLETYSEKSQTDEEHSASPQSTDTSLEQS